MCNICYTYYLARMSCLVPGREPATRLLTEQFPKKLE